MLSAEVNYSVDILFYFLDNDLNLNICKSWVKYLDDKSLLTPYLVKYSRDSEWVELLLTFYPQVDYRYNNDELLASCCRCGHLDIVEWLINKGANIRVINYEPFRYACEFGHLETAEYLLSLINADDEERKLCIHSSDDYALRLSANNGHIDIVKWLVNNGANMKINNYEPLRCAHQNEHVEIAKYLSRSINSNRERKLYIQSNNDRALTWSARDGHLEVVEWLANNGADFKVDNYEPFRYACEYGHLETAEYLLSLIDTDEEKKLCVQSDNDYALRLSVNKRHFGVVEWLVNNGADIRVNNYQPFRYACQEDHLETVECLLSLIDTDEEKKLCVQSNSNYTLRFSAKHGHLEMVKWLVNNGADIRVNNYEPFRYACKEGHLEIAKYLLSLIDTDEEKKLCIQSDNNRALICSAYYHHFEIVKWLATNGADIRINDYEVFQCACDFGHLETAQYLLSLIDTDEEKKLCVQSNNNCALIWSVDEGHFEVVKWLVDNGADIRAEDYQVIQSARETEIRDYLLDQLTEEERLEIIDALN